MSNKTKYLFLLTISPVQSFIAQARKTQDLYAGSQILSDLVKTGIEKFNKTFREIGSNSEVIFPNIKADVESDSLPNRFIAKVIISEDVITDIPSWLKLNGKEIEKSVKDRWIGIASDVVGSNSPTGFWQQIEQHLDIHWAFEKIELNDNNQEDYKTAYKNIESLIGAIKNVRPFEQYNYQMVKDSDTKEEILIVGEQGRKCSIDGQNNALFYRPIEKDDGSTRKLNFMAGKPKPEKGFLLEQGEGLSAISYVKRKYRKNKIEFPSTAQIALLQDEKNLPSEKRDLFECYKNLFENKEGRNLFVESCIELFKNEKIDKLKIQNIDEKDKWLENFDYQLLYEENLVIKSIANHEQLKVANIVLPHFKSHFKQKYYALILFDGDKMGKWLSGENLIPPYKEERLEEFHKEFSNLLSKFGEKATKDIHESKYNGKTVYAGGDDYLGFVNLECLFDVMSKLRKDFDELVGSKLKAKGYTERNITFSAGIVVASYKMPLSEVLKKAREVEKIAKNKADRNAFAISVMKSSGEIQQATFKWDKDETGVENWKHIQTITNFLRDEKFSNKFISSLSKELYQLAGIELDSIAENEENEDLEKAIICEIKRLVKRASSKETTKLEIKDMQDVVTSLWENAKPTININKVENFIHSLHISDFLHRRLNKNN